MYSVRRAEFRLATDLVQGNSLENVAEALDLAISDYELPERRLMHRTTVAGGVPL